ncbi:hypothetical protein ACFFGH_29270 [Lysobacter korlensis]|uniref:DUF2474 domain-containing protein n=1 Tax=Lysobacter korlensis TaxID=553636 RepID=A0ABV6S1D7_9GAMM
MSAADQNSASRNRMRAILKVWVLTVSGTASVALGALALTRPY